MKVNEIFTSINGEGTESGYLTVFLRLAGCNVRCSYCDTLYALYQGTVLTVGEVKTELEKNGVPERVTITGGEPLLQAEEVLELIRSMPETDFEVETNGLVDFRPFLRLNNVYLTVDWKTPSSGVMNSAYILRDHSLLRPMDCIKFVIGKGDWPFVENIIREMETCASVILSPVRGEIEPREIAEKIIEKKWWKVRMQVQLHKVIWGPEVRGV